ncbi:hypothetical protein [Oleidesulfovibrio sp.]|uniref:hypothetical protein n=1 Tax=Oleidesulfovibrio sp. TaxID=2909707 RepID=UPI003A8AD168
MLFTTIRRLTSGALGTVLLLGASVQLALAEQAEATEAVAEGWKLELALFLNTKWGQYAMIGVFFFLIIAYLRFLFGPKGLMREKKWDEWNEQARKAKEEAKKKNPDAKERPSGLFYRGGQE